jgi:hypothetical protein
MTVLWRGGDSTFSRRDTRNCRSLGSPGFPVESCGFGLLHVVLFKENHISGAGESCEVGNPGTLRDDEGEGDTSMKGSFSIEGVCCQPSHCGLFAVPS